MGGDRILPMGKSCDRCLLFPRPSVQCAFYGITLRCEHMGWVTESDRS